MEHMKDSEANEERKLQEWKTAIEHNFSLNSRNGNMDITFWDSVTGWKKACSTIYNLLWQNIMENLPKVLEGLANEIAQLETEKMALKLQEEMGGEDKLRASISTVMHALCQKIQHYLKGNLEVAAKVPQAGCNLVSEIWNDYQHSPLAHFPLNWHDNSEKAWFEFISKIDFNQMNVIHPEKKLFGSKQFQRALAFVFLAITKNLDMAIMSSPDSVLNAIGYNKDGFIGENWEHACLEIVRVCALKALHPGINWFARHSGFIFWRFLSVAWQDLSEGEEHSDLFKILTPQFRGDVASKYLALLQNLMKESSTNCHNCVKPTYRHLVSNFKVKVESLHQISAEEEKAGRSISDENEPNSILKKVISSPYAGVAFGLLETLQTLLQKNHLDLQQKPDEFLRAKRSSMTTDPEVNVVVEKAIHYLCLLIEYQTTRLEFNFNEYFLQGFKDSLEPTLNSSHYSFEELQQLFAIDLKSVALKKKEVEAKLKSALQLKKRIQDVLSGQLPEEVGSASSETEDIDDDDGKAKEI